MTDAWVSGVVMQYEGLLVKYAHALKSDMRGDVYSVRCTRVVKLVNGIE